MSDLQQQPVKEFTDEGQQPNLLCLSSRDLEINENQWCVCWGVLLALDLVHSCVPVPSIPPQHDPRPTKQSFITFPELAAWPEIWALMSFFCVVFLLFEKVPGLTLILLHAELWNHSLHPHKSSFRWSCTKNWQETCGGGEGTVARITSLPMFGVSLTSETSEAVKRRLFSSLREPETEIPSRKKAAWWLRVWVEGRLRASADLLLLEGQPECGIKAFISSHSLCVLFQQIFQTHTLRLFHHRVKSTKTFLI